VKPDERLEKLAILFREKNNLYGDQYLKFGHLMIEFLGPIKIETAHDYNRIMTIFNIFTKLDRYCHVYPGHHSDSLDDLSIYAQMLQEISEK
jgi:hypothetical protein